jgi:Fuc2NAc and GlcNAc transferase
MVSVVVTRLVLSYAQRRLMDQPNERSSHQRPTPRGGGLGLVTGLLVAGTSALLAGDQASALPLLLPVATMAALGWWDDHASLSARLRLVVQFILVGALAWIIGIPDVVTLGSWRVAIPPLLPAMLLVVGGVWLVNLTNFMDGIDGIAGIQGLVGCFGLVLLVQAEGGPTMDAAVAVLVASGGACAGFLVWNRPPARIFMGDVGSTALGLVFALGIIAGMRVGVAVDLLLLPLMPFIADATCTLARRAWRRERLSQAHRSHLYQRLARHWSSHRPVTLLYGGLASFGAGLALATQRGLLPPLLGLGLWLIVWWLLVAYGRRSCPADPAAS